jgi:hypothetical protein
MTGRKGMKRKDFLRLMVAGAGSLALSSMLPSCASSDRKKLDERVPADAPADSVISLEGTLVGDPFSKELVQLISKYSYGQLNILKNEVEILYNEASQEMLLHPFYQHNIYSTEGCCTELMGTAFKDIKEKYPDHYVMRAYGTDPDYFNDAFADHYFLLLSEKNLMGKAEFIDKEAKISDILEKDPLLVDPSFKKVMRFSGSGYKVRQLFGENYKFNFSNALFFSEIDYESCFSVPLLLTNQKELMLLSPDFESPSLLSIGFQKRRQSPEFFDLKSSTLAYRAEADPKSAEMLNLFRKQEIFSTDANLMQEYMLLSY